MQSGPRAELEAIAQVVENGKAFLFTYTDQVNHGKGFRKGPGYCCKATNKQVDIWRRIWSQAKRLETQNTSDLPAVQVRWIPSHQKAKKGETKEDRLNREGNDAADDQKFRPGSKPNHRIT